MSSASFKEILLFSGVGVGKRVLLFEGYSVNKAAIFFVRAIFPVV
jgi:hypothetical protein